MAINPATGDVMGIGDQADLAHGETFGNGNIIFRGDASAPPDSANLSNFLATSISGSTIRRPDCYIADLPPIPLYPLPLHAAHACPRPSPRYRRT